MLHSKIMPAMSEGDGCYMLQGKVQLDDACFGGERPGGQAGRGSENKVPIVAAISLNAEGQPIHAKVSPIAGFTIRGPVCQGCQPLSKCCSVLPDGLTCFSGTVHAFAYGKCAKRYLGGFCFLLNRRFKLSAITERIGNAVCVCKPCPERALRAAELYA